MVKAKGKFTKVGRYIFRTEASLQFGKSNDIIGMIVLFNPGSSRLLNTSEWDKFEDCESGHVEGELWLDPTMDTIAKILLDVNPKTEGVLLIHNLFNLRDGNMENAIKKYEELCACNEFEKVLHTDFSNIKECNLPWIWLAWGVKPKVTINKRKKRLKTLIDKCNLTKFAEYPNGDQSSIHTYHVRPHLKEQQIIYAQKIKAQMNKEFGIKQKGVI